MLEGRDLRSKKAPGQVHLKQGRSDDNEIRQQLLASPRSRMCEEGLTAMADGNRRVNLRIQFRRLGPIDFVQH